MKNVLHIGMICALAGCAIDATPDVTPNASDESAETTGGVAVEPVRSAIMQRSLKEIGPSETMSYPAAKVLDTSETRYFVEPEGGTKKDDAGHSYTDSNY